MSEQPEYASLAQTAWENATTCVGWEAPAAPEVRISDQDCGENFVGCAHLEGHQLSSINIEPGGLRPASQVMAHEIAHAWFAGPPGLAEGGAQLLADCILAAEPDWPAISQSTEPPKVGTFDLRTWKNRDDSDATREGDQVAYLLVAQVMTVIPMSELPLVSTSWAA